MSTPSKREIAENVINNMRVGKWISLHTLVERARCGRLFSVSRISMARYLLEHKDCVERKVENRLSFYRRIKNGE